MMVTDNRSQHHLHRAIQGLGRFYDFYNIIYEGKPLAANEMRGMMRQFFEAREYGNEKLGWAPVSNKTAINDVKYASEFSKFCHDNFGTLSINPYEQKLLQDLNVSAHTQYYAELKQRSKRDMLQHLAPETQLGRGIIGDYSFSPQPKSLKQAQHNDYFPPEKVLPLLASTKNIRDLLAFIILFFGGLRESELFHLFVTDITTPKEDEPGQIRLAHPELGIYRWNSPFTGVHRGTRAEFLWDRYQLTPRNRLAIKNPAHAGWKGMMYTHKGYGADFFWLVPEMGRLFAKLHRRYMHETRSNATDNHPYYFINAKNKDFGRPLTMSNLTKSFYRAAARVGLRASDPGVNPHGARHFYGYFSASFLDIPMLKLQVMMRHASIQSTQIYYSINERIVREAIKKGQERMYAEIPDFVTTMNKMIERL
jgi:integrase